MGKLWAQECVKLFWLTDLQHFNLTQQKFPLGSLDVLIGKLHILKNNKLSSHDTGKAITMVPHEALKSGMLDTSEVFLISVLRYHYSIGQINIAHYVAP